MTTIKITFDEFTKVGIEKLVEKYPEIKKEKYKFMKGYGEATDWAVRLSAVKLYFKMFGLDRVPEKQELSISEAEETLDLSGWSKKDLLNAITEEETVNGKAKATN